MGGISELQLHIHRHTGAVGGEGGFHDLHVHHHLVVGDDLLLLPVDGLDEVAVEIMHIGGRLDALGGVVKRVPVMDPKGLVIDHVLTPIIGGKIEGGAPDKVLYYRVPDDSLRGFRVHAGDLLLTVPESRAQDGALMLVEYKGQRMVRKLLKMDGMRIQMQAFDREFEAVIAPAPEVRVLGRCVKLMRTL